MEFLSIDGTMGEGGGSIARLSAGFAVLFDQPIHLINIRANRNPPGLRLQHQLGFETLRQLSEGNLSPIEVGTTDLKFNPGKGGKTTLEVHIRTAGSIALLSQTIQTAFIQSKQGTPLKIHYIGGGTFGMGAPDPYYLNNVTYQLFSKMGYRCHIDVKRNGYYPKGGADASLSVYPVTDISYLKPLTLNDKGNLLEVGGIIVSSENLRKPKVAERIEKSIIENLRDHPYFSDISIDNYKIQRKYEHTLNPGVGLSIWAKFSNTIIGTGTILGKRGISSEMIGETTANMLIKESTNSATLDSYAADQIIPLLVMCPRKSSIRIREISSHMKTNIELLQKFQPRDYSLSKSGDAWILEYKSMN